MGKGEIANNEQFLLFPQCFQKTCTADTYKPGLVWERVKGILTKIVAFAPSVDQGQAALNVLPDLRPTTSATLEKLHAKDS